MTVIKAEDLSKYYKLGVINNGTFFRDVQTWWALKRGKQDPHSRLDEQHKYDPTKEGFWALKNLNFEITQGDRVGIIGKNGAGKSTLLKLLSRITAPTEGCVKIKGRVASLLEVGTGFHGELTGRENIYLNGAILGMKRREVDRKIDEIIAFSEIEHHIDTPVKRYSSGMYVRLAFAVAAHLDSEILIADEVLAVGDAIFQKKALGKMNELSTGEGRTVLFVSHNMTSVKALCNKGIVLEKGRVVYDGDLDGAIKHYMTDGEKKEVQNVWTNPQGYKHRNCTFNKVSIVNEKDELIVDTTRDINSKIYIKIECNIEEVSQIMNIGITLVNSDNTVVFSTWLKDVMENDFKINKGENLFYIKIPNEILNIDTYGVILSAGLHHVDFILPPEHNIPITKFDITGLLGVHFGDDNRKGTIVPLIKWEK